MKSNAQFLETLVRLQGEITTEDIFCVLATTDEFCATLLRSVGFCGEVADSYKPYIGKKGTLRFSQKAEEAMRFALPYESTELFGLYLMLATVKYAEGELMQILIDFGIKAEPIEDAIASLSAPIPTELSVTIKRPDSVFSKKPRGI